MDPASEPVFVLYAEGLKAEAEAETMISSSTVEQLKAMGNGGADVSCGEA